MCDLCRPRYRYGGYGSNYLYHYYDDFDFLPPKPKDEPNPANNLPKVGDTIYAHQSQGLPVGSLLKSETGELFARTRQYNDTNYFLMSLDSDTDEVPKYVVTKFTILFIPGWKTDFQIGDVVSHAQAQLLPRFTVLVYEPDEWMKRHCPTYTDPSSQSHWYVTNEKVSNRCGVVKPMNGENHWATFYKIVYLPGGRLNKDH